MLENFRFRISFEYISNIFFLGCELWFDFAWFRICGIWKTNANADPCAVFEYRTDGLSLRDWEIERCQRLCFHGDCGVGVAAGRASSARLPLPFATNARNQRNELHSNGNRLRARWGDAGQSERAPASECYFFNPPTHRHTHTHKHGERTGPKRYRYVLQEMRAQKFYCITFAYEWQIRNERRAKCVSIRFVSYFATPPAAAATTAAQQQRQEEYLCEYVCVSVSAIVQNQNTNTNTNTSYECLLRLALRAHTYPLKKGSGIRLMAVWVCVCATPKNTMTNVIKRHTQSTPRTCCSLALSPALSRTFVLFIFSIQFKSSLSLARSFSLHRITFYISFAFQFHFVSALPLSLALWPGMRPSCSHAQVGCNQ